MRPTLPIIRYADVLLMYAEARTKRFVAVVKAQNPSIVVQEQHYLFPIPQTQRDVNPALKQNPGY